MKEGLYKDIVCKGFCKHYKEGREGLYCNSYKLIKENLTVNELRAISDNLKRQGISSTEIDGEMKERVCKGCDFLVDGCDFVN